MDTAKNSATLSYPSAWKFFASPRVIHLKMCGNSSLTENLHTRKLEEITALYAVEDTFAIIYLCLLFSTRLDFSINMPHVIFFLAVTANSDVD